MIFVHHKQALDRLAEELKQDSNVLALITAGSIAQGTARESSDIDVYIVVTDEEFKKRTEENNITYINNSRQICDYPDGYVDGKIINLDFLEQAAKRGSEPTRASFIGSQVWFSRISKLEELLLQIPVFPEKSRSQNIKDFQAQLMLYGFYFSTEAIKKNNAYLLAHSTNNIVLYASRIILAYNRILFPYHKSLMAAVQQASVKPDNFIDQANALLAQPSLEGCQALATTMLSFFQPDFAPEKATSIFIQNNEWNWLEQETPLSDR